MALYGSFGGSRAVSLALTMAAWGAPVVDAVLADERSVPDAAALVVANATFQMAITRQSTFAGQRRIRAVGGAGGWRKRVAAQSYQNPAGIPLSMVLRDAAIAVGESVKVQQDRSVGVDFVREACEASRVLRQLVGRGWWVDAAGVTQIGVRPSTKVGSEFLVSDYDGACGRVVVATEDVAAWQPGASFQNKLLPQQLTASSVSVYMGKGGKLRVEVLVA